MIYISINCVYFFKKLGIFAENYTIHLVLIGCTLPRPSIFGPHELVPIFGPHELVPIFGPYELVPIFGPYELITTFGPYESITIFGPYFRNIFSILFLIL